jgi:hypothetical protein
MIMRAWIAALAVTVACSSGAGGTGGASLPDPADPGNDPGAPQPDDPGSGDAGDELTLTIDEGGDDDASDDAPPPSSGRCDPGKPFGAPSPLASVNSTADESSARLSPDELTLYLGSARSGTYDMFVATRADVTADFASPIPLANLSTTNQESHGLVTKDGLTMYLGWAKPGDPFHLAVAVRPAVVAEFGAPQLVANVNSQTALDNDPMLDDGGEDLYFTSTRAANNIDIYRATKTPAGAFGAPAPIAEIDTAAAEHMPVLTPDGLALYFASNRLGKSDDVWIARRALASQPFGAPTLVAELSSDVDDAPTWVSGDECTIYLRRGASGGPRDIFVASRPK